MSAKPLYRWEVRRAAKIRREQLSGRISTHDLVILAIIMAMLVIVLRIIMILGMVLGMEIGPFSSLDSLKDFKDLPYADLNTVTDSFNQLKLISIALLAYWATASWKSFTSLSVSLSTKLFKATIGATILLLLAASFSTDHALFLANIWFEPPFHPLD